MNVARTVCLTLPHQSERQKPFLDWWVRRPLPAGVPVPKFRFGVDGPDHARGCSQSHANALYEFAAEPGDPSDWLLVLEDDARWGAELNRVWPLVRDAIPAGADMVFLGGALSETGTTEAITERLAWARGIYRMHAYLIRRGSAFRAARIMSGGPDICDVMVSRASESGALKVCAVRPFVVAQRPGRDWYAWNPGEREIRTEAGLEIYARYALGVPAAEQRRVILYGSDATAFRVRGVAGARLHVVAHAEGDIAVLSADPEDAPKPAAGAKPADETRKRELLLARTKCDDLGAKVSGGGCGLTVFRCDRHDTTTVRAGGCADAARSCARCDDHSALRAATASAVA